jgi:AAA domain, putative AbiEii toxin, Type IV TA system
MRLFVQSTRREPQFVEPAEALILLSDTWNDYSYRTLYALHLQRAGSMRRIGWVKILKLGQREGSPPLPHGELADGILPDDYGSLGSDLDYYQSVAELGLRDEVVRRLRDIAVDASHRSRFADEPGLSRSLNRDRREPEDFYEDARVILFQGGRIPSAGKWRFTFRSPDESDPIDFDFRTPGLYDPDEELPGALNRTMVLVGPNGAGKTRLLARLARVAYAPPAERDEVAEDGAIDEDIAFPGIVAMSYSSFDDFLPPKLTGDDVEEVIKRLEEGTGRYAYCGLRDLASVYRQPDRAVPLLDQEKLATNFVDRLHQIEVGGRGELFRAVLGTLLRESSFKRRVQSPDEASQVVFDDGPHPLTLVLGDDLRHGFRHASSGHQIVLHGLASLCATVHRRALVLIDEPETHLHPPLLAAYLTAIRRLLRRLRAHAVIATHSPVIVQESLASQVRIIEGGRGGFTVRRPELETFGENIGTLTRETFGLHTGATDFRTVLDSLVALYGGPEAVEAALGTELPSQAKAHLIGGAKQPN